ncbi:MAG: integrase arm-type DNA-binding domain-containing protein [Methylovirgula sp.]
MGRLTDRSVKSVLEGRHGDGDGLHLVVAKSGRRKWVLRYQINGARRDMGLGSYPSVGLSEARIAAADARKLMAQGVDPLQTRRTARKAGKRSPTFQEIAELVIADAQSKSSNAKVRYQWERHLGRVYCGPLLSRPVHEITTVDVAAVLRPVWREKPEVARKLYPAIRRVFEHARIRLRDDHGIAMPDNPARWDDLKAMGFELPEKLSRGSHPSLSYTQAPAFMSDLRMRDAVTARALEFLILTNLRTDAVLKARWQEIDLANALWTVPLANLKDRKHRKEGFRVPLSDRAIEIIRAMKETHTSVFVFPAHRSDRPLSNMAMLTLLKRMNSGSEAKWLDTSSKRPITVHGFRATFRTWAEETTGFPHAVIEQAMGHQVGTQAERAYRRTDVLERRRGLMAAWAQHCEPKKSAKVISIRKPAAGRK